MNTERPTKKDPSIAENSDDLEKVNVAYAMRQVVYIMLSSSTNCIGSDKTCQQTSGLGILLE